MTGLRSILNVPEAKLAQSKFPMLARLLYRDSLKQKHQDQSRLREELVKKGDKGEQLSRGQAKVKSLAAATVESTPLADMTLKHLIAAFGPRFAISRFPQSLVA